MTQGCIAQGREGEWPGARGQEQPFPTAHPAPLGTTHTSRLQLQPLSHASPHLLLLVPQPGPLRGIQVAAVVLRAWAESAGVAFDRQSCSVLEANPFFLPLTQYFHSTCPPTQMRARKLQ